MPRVVSLLPSATEMVCALGARESLVGRSHECDFPEGLDHVPVLTRARLGAAANSGAIDRAVRSVLEQALAIYEIDAGGLAQARPDVILTQDLCEVCAVGIEDVRRALVELSRPEVELVTLHPRRLRDVWNDIARVGRAIGRDSSAPVRELEDRVEAIRARALRSRRPRVLSLEWLDPVMVGGLWMPELIELAGGEPLVTRAGELAPTLSRDELADLEPEIVLIKPCGYRLDDALAELPLLREKLPWERWSARGVQLYVTDGNAYFNRSGPRLVESLEILAACLDRGAFADFGERHASALRRVTPALDVLPGFASP